MSKVLFHSTNPLTFRSTFIGYIYEVAQQHQVVLLTEKIDDHTMEVLGNKSIFPGLEQIIFFESHFHGNIVAKNYRLHKIIKETVQSFKPDIVVAHSDTWPTEMYAMRRAKQEGAITLAMQAGFRIAEQEKLFRWSCLMNVHNKMLWILPKN